MTYLSNTLRKSLANVLLVRIMLNGDSLSMESAMSHQAYLLKIFSRSMVSMKWDCYRKFTPFQHIY